MRYAIHMIKVPKKHPVVLEENSFRTAKQKVKQLNEEGATGSFERKHYIEDTKTGKLYQ